MEWLGKWLPLYEERERCSRHPKQFNTFYCSACMGRPVCVTCWRRDHSHLHQGNRHRILQAVSASERAAIKVAHIEKFVDASEIQVYRINGNRIYHLHPKASESERGGTIDGPRCVTCRKSLKKSGNRFCSIACKFETEGVNLEIKCEPESGSTSPSSDIDFEMGETCLASVAISSSMKFRNRRRGAIKHKIEMGKKTMNVSDQCSSFVSQRKRSRKGIPRRAPLQ